MQIRQREAFGAVRLSRPLFGMGANVARRQPCRRAFAFRPHNSTGRIARLAKPFTASTGRGRATLDPLQSGVRMLSDPSRRDRLRHRQRLRLRCRACP
jgi:hypothetical protein